MVTVTTTNRPYRASINGLWDEKGYMDVNVRVSEVDKCVSSIMMAVQDYGVDAACMAIGVCFMLMLSRYHIQVSSFFNVLENFMYRGGHAPEDIVGMKGAQRMFATWFTDKVRKNQVINLAKEIRVDI